MKNVTPNVQIHAHNLTIHVIFPQLLKIRDKTKYSIKSRKKKDKYQNKIDTNLETEKVINFYFPT